MRAQKQRIYPGRCSGDAPTRMTRFSGLVWQSSLRCTSAISVSVVTSVRSMATALLLQGVKSVKKYVFAKAVGCQR